MMNDEVVFRFFIAVCLLGLLLIAGSIILMIATSAVNVPLLILACGMLCGLIALLIEAHRVRNEGEKTNV